MDIKHAGRRPTPPTTASTGRSAGAGRAQFVADHQRGDDADNGIEADNNEFNNNVLPRSNPQIYNFTICGDPDRNEGGESVRGRHLPPRHGVHLPQLPDHRLQDHRAADRRRGDARRGQQRHVADGRRRHLEHRRRWRSGRNRDPFERGPLHHQRPIPERVANVDGGLSPDCSQPREPRTSSRRRSRHWRADSWRRSCRRTTGSSRRSPTSAPFRRHRPTTGRRAGRRTRSGNRRGRSRQ